MTVTAHAGHWLLQLVYAFPILLVLGFILFDRARAKRLGDEEGDEPGST